MPITTSTLITKESYNDIHLNVRSILRNYYGYSTESIEVTEGMTVTADDWRKLYNDINRCIVHQTDNEIPLSGISVASTGSLITANFCNLLEQKAIEVVTNKDNVGVNQLSQNEYIEDRRDSDWGSSIRLVATYTWINSNDADLFFNLGGFIKTNVTVTGDEGWAELFSSLNQFQSYTNGDFDYNATLSNSWSNGDGVRQVVITYTKPNNSQVRAEINFNINEIGVNYTILPVVRVSARRSLDNGTPAGINAPIPLGAIEVSLDIAGGFVEIPKVRNLVISPTSLSFSTNNETPSSLQSVTLTNSGGNDILQVTNIEPSSNFVTYRLFHDFNVFTGYPILIAPNESYTFQIGYSGTQAGSFSNNIAFYSNDTVSTYKSITVNTEITQAPFNFTLSPSSWSITVSNDSAINQTFIINANQSFSSYVASISNYHDLAYGLNTTRRTGPNVQFSGYAKPNGTYETTLSVTVNGLTRTAQITVIFDGDVSLNLGTWKSAAAYANSVIGMSYDIISGVRYLTIGVAVGSDGAPSIQNGGDSYALTNNLGINSDDKYNSGPAVYKTSYGEPWSEFMQTYGVWVQSENSSAPTNVDISRSYTINFPSNSAYTWQMAVDNYGYFTIDNTIIGDLRNDGGSFSTSYSGTFVTSQGNHTLTFVVNNVGSVKSGNPGGMAIRILRQEDNLEIWSTLSPVRGTLPYLYWNEVYRIPITYGAHTYRSSSYLIKANTAIDGKNWGDYFGSGINSRSMFNITDDGYGNLSITLNEKTSSSGNGEFEATLQSLTYAFYYYTDNYPQFRYTNLENPVNGQTKLFTGFRSRGTVTTSVVNVPVDTNPPVIYPDSPGDGGGVAPF